MQGTASWLDRVASTYSSIDRALKAGPPAPGRLYAPAQGGVGPISWEGWPDRGGTGRGLAATITDLSTAQRDEQVARGDIINTTVYAAINAIANEMMVAQVKLKKRVAKGDEDLENAPFERLWEAPNPFMGRGFVMAFWAWNLLLSGRGYLFARPVNGEITELWPIPSWRIAPVRHPEKFIEGYALKVEGAEQAKFIDAKYVCYTRIPHPFDIYDGLAPGAAARVAIESDKAMAKWNESFFSEENAVPSGLVSVPKDTLDQDIARVRAELRDFFGGANKRRVAVARAGDLAWQAFGHTQKEMEFLSGREFSQKEIMRVYGIPEGYFSEQANRANAEQARATMIENAVWPKLIMLAEDLNAQWGGRWWAEEERVAFDDIRPRNRELELKEFSSWSTVLTVGELRKLIKYDALGDYRDKLTIEELKKAMALPGTEASIEAEEAVAALEAAAGGGEEGEDVAPEALEAAPTLDEETPPEGMGDAPALDAEPGVEAAKAADLERWERKALKALKLGRRPAVPFVPDALGDGEAAAIRTALEAAESLADVRAAFKAVAEPGDEGDVWSEAERWARLALKEG
jgi:HK97 family phage portal protein